MGAARFLTPKNDPDGAAVCRPVWLPPGTEWEALVRGALSDLADSVLFEKSIGGLDPDAVSKLFSDQLARTFKSWLDCAPQYFAKIISINRAALIGYWRCNEASGTLANDSSGLLNDALLYGLTPGAPGIGDGESAFGGDGANDALKIYSTGLRDNFDGQLGTLLFWFKAQADSVWTDGVARYLARLYASAGNDIFVYKVGNRQLDFVYRAGGTTKTVSSGSLSGTDWHSVALRWNKPADKYDVWFGAAQLGSQSGLGTWTGALNTAGTVLFAADNGGGLSWYGAGAHGALWSDVLTDEEIVYVSTL
jgi:hypothetical protein